MIQILKLHASLLKIWNPVQPTDPHQSNDRCDVTKRVPTLMSFKNKLYTYVRIYMSRVKEDMRKMNPHIVCYYPKAYNY